MNLALHLASLSIRRKISLAAGLACLSICGPLSAGVVLNGGGLILAEEAGTFDVGNISIGGGTYPFATGQLGPSLGLSSPYHYIAALNDGIYGNPSSWIGGTGDPGPWFAGVGFGGSFNIQSFAFGRSNVTSGDPCGGGVCVDRNLGLYTLQYTNVPGANASNPASDWITIGTIDNQGAGGGVFQRPWRRHRYNFDGVAATALRMLVPGTGIGPEGTAIDEIEVYQNPGIVTPPPPPYVLTPASAQYQITFNGNNGDHFTHDEPALVPDNPAMASHGAAYFTSSDLGPAFGLPYHHNFNINDGQYGNSFSWIADFANGDADPFAGVAFASPVSMSGIAFGRDNGNDAGDCCGGQLMDRWQGTYTIQFTRSGAPDGSTPETGDPATGWATIGTIEYLFQEAGFDPWLRHEFGLSESGGSLFGVTGLRIKVSDPNIAIDEIELIGPTGPADAQWNLDADGSWGEAGNWLPTLVPDGAGSKARFLGGISGARTVSLDGDRYVGEMYFDNSQSYTIDGGGAYALVIDNGANPGLIQVDSGDHAINAFVNISQNALANIAPGASLSINNSTFLGAGTILLKAGEGTLNMGNVYGDGAVEVAGGKVTANYFQTIELTIHAGSVVEIHANGTEAGTSHVNALNIEGGPGAWQGKLDLTDNDLIVQAAPGAGADILAQITDQIASGRNAPAGFWEGNGIVSSAAKLDATTLTGLGAILNGQDGLPLRTEFDGLPTDADSVLVKYTWNGDADLSGQVDADDYFRIDSGFAAAGALLGWANGDFDYSGGAPDADDYFMIDSAFAGQSGLLGGVAAVPEPATLSAVMLGLAGLMRRSRRARSIPV